MTQREIKDIVKELCSMDEKKFYVYMLCDKNNKPFYIGKGERERVWQHEKDAAADIEEKKERIKEITEKIKKDKKLTEIEKTAKINFETALTEKDIKAKYDKIKEIGVGNVKKVIVKWGLTNNEALMAESALINAYNLTTINSLTNVVNGHMSEPEKQNIACETKARTIEDFLRNCVAEEKSIAELEGIPVMFVKINTSYQECKNIDDEFQEKAIYDCARAAWKVGKEKLKYLTEIQYVFAMYKSKVVGIYPVDEKSWTMRKDIADNYDFPEYPTKVRELERKYTLALAKCKTPEEAEQICKTNDELNYDEFNQISKGENFKTWCERMFFVKSERVIPEQVSAFLNNRIGIPQKNDKPRNFEQNELYNFNIINGRLQTKKYPEISEE